MFDKANILELFKDKATIMCPFTGCVAQLERSGLELDDILAADIEQWLKLRAQRAEAEDADEDAIDATQQASQKKSSPRKRGRE